MRRVRLSLVVVFFLLSSLPTTFGGESDGAAHGLSDDALLALALSDMDVERSLAAQALQQADRAQVLRFFERLRARLGLVKEEPPMRLAELAKQRAAGAAEQLLALITTEVQVLQLTTAERKALYTTLGATPPGDGLVLDDAGLQVVAGAMAARAGVGLLTAPRLSMIDGRAASLTVMNQIAYVSGFRVERRGDGEIADPQVGVLLDGLVMRLQGRVEGEGKTVALDLRATWADLVRPLPVFEGKLGQSLETVQVQVPETRFAHVATTLHLPQGRSVLMPGPRRGAGEETLLLVRAGVRHVTPGLLEDLAPEAASEAKTLVQAEVRVLEIPVEARDGLLGAYCPTSAHEFVPLDAAQAEALLARIEAHPDAKTVSAPRLTVEDRQRANVSILQEVSYVQDVEVEIAGSEKIATPVIGTLQEGILLEFEPQVDAAAHALDVTILLTSSRIKRPIAEKEIFLEGAGKNVTIQLPEVDISRVKASGRIPDEGWVLVGSPARPDGGHQAEWFALVHVKTIPPPR